MQNTITKKNVHFFLGHVRSAHHKLICARIYSLFRKILLHANFLPLEIGFAIDSVSVSQSSYHPTIHTAPFIFRIYYMSNLHGIRFDRIKLFCRCPIIWRSGCQLADILNVANERVAPFLVSCVIHVVLSSLR